MKEPDPSQIFYNTIKTLINNLIAHNPNFSYDSDYFDSLSKYDLKKEVEEKGRYILEKMDQTKHLIGLE